MKVTVELTYDMAKLLGLARFDVENARTVADVLSITRARAGEKGAEFEKHARISAVAVNGVLTNHRRGLSTALADGDLVSFLKAAAGG
ncbi:MAG: MoaD/ThiS family protein [Planctomycetes bacterium]|nr:MoaD/ThiS family protein [Planctomycetota bacterium]